MAPLLRLVLAVLLAMVFDMGFNFRATAGFVTDPAYGVPVLNEVYPHTYTNANGDSINAGWDSAVDGGLDRTAANDPRIAGINYLANINGVVRFFKVDLSSGSAPGAGTNTVDLAIGDAGNNQNQLFQLLDTSTVLIDGTNGGAGIGTTTGQFVDATLTVVSATTTWIGATVSKVFATTLAQLSIGGVSNGVFTTPAHFRLTRAAASGPVMAFQSGQLTTVNPGYW